MALAAERRWRDISLADIAAEAKGTRDPASRRLPIETGDHRGAGRPPSTTKVLADDEEAAGEPVQERLLDVLIAPIRGARPLQAGGGVDYPGRWRASAGDPVCRPAFDAVDGVVVGGRGRQLGRAGGPGFAPRGSPRSTFPLCSYGCATTARTMGRTMAHLDRSPQAGGPADVRAALRPPPRPRRARGRRRLTAILLHCKKKSLTVHIRSPYKLRCAMQYRSCEKPGYRRPKMAKKRKSFLPTTISPRFGVISRCLPSTSRR